MENDIESARSLYYTLRIGNTKNKQNPIKGFSRGSGNLVKNERQFFVKFWYSYSFIKLQYGMFLIIERKKRPDLMQ